MPPKKPLQQITCDVEAFTSEGFGLAYITRSTGERVPVAIPCTMPGDHVLVTLLKRHRRQNSGRLDQVIHPAADRVTPRCVHFGACGGCRWQHVPYAEQLAMKQARVQALFASLLDPAAQQLPILPCDPPWAYRNKMEFSFSSDSKGERYLGLVLQGGRGHVFHLTECHLVDSWMAQCVDTVRAWWREFPTLDAYHGRSDRGSLRTLTVREGKRTGDRLVMLTVSGNPDFALSKEALDAFKQRLIAAITPTKPEARLSLFLCIQQIGKGRKTQFYEMLLHGPDHVRERLFVEAIRGAGAKALSFKIAPRAFFQPNPLQAERLYSHALQLLDLKPSDVVYDLYCGTGTLGIAAAAHVRQVVGIELSPESAIDARGNATDNQCENVKIHTGDVSEVLRRLQETGTLEAANCVMVDPPRAGLTEEAIAQVLQLDPQQILYISCNPETQAPNVAQLCAAGYQLVAIQPVDQFPHTIHTENIALLRRVPR